MGSTDKLTPTYITPLRRSLGLSRRLKSNTNSPITPSSITTPLRTSCNYNSPSSTKNINNENLNKTPILNITPQIPKCVKSPLKSESVNRTESSKRRYRLSLNQSKIQGIPLMKKKKLEFIENGYTSDDETENTVEPLLKIISFGDGESRHNEELEDDYISSSQMVTFEILTQIPNTDLESNEELANEFKEIELLKQKQYRRRISYGLKVREDKLKDIEELNASIQLKDLCKEIEPSQNVQFQTAKQQIEAIPDLSTKQQSHQQEIGEIKNLIKIWRRGLRDAVEYLSCLSYPPTDIRAILRHHDIPPELLID